MFEKFRATLEERLDRIDWGSARNIYPEFGGASDDSLPSLTYRLTSPEVIPQSHGTPLLLTAEVSFQSIDENNWTADLGRLHGTLGRDYTIRSFDIEHEVNEDGTTIYSVVIGVIDA